MLVVAPRRVPLWIAVVLLAAFAMIHGQAHVVAATMHSAPLAFSAGFAVSTLALCCAGLLGAAVAQRCDRASLLRVAGASAAVAGMVLTTLLAVR
jgi:urease accessory protein